MTRHLAYLKYVLIHKWYVFLACLKLGVPTWIAILHDWDKFLPDEWFPYARFFHNPDGSKRQKRDKTGYYKPTDTGSVDFDQAWLFHARRNKHHWQYWVLATEDGEKIYPIPEQCMREMLADWIGAGKAQGTPNTWEWYEQNKDKIKLHPDTRTWVEQQMKLLEQTDRTKRAFDAGFFG